jgi:hypothetical protein
MTNLPNKYFIITIDTEGDNLWDHRIGDPITTTNTQYIPRFQKLCNKYNFKPVYLTNYEMANDTFFAEFAKNELEQNNCEIGIHLHAWNNPPFHELEASGNDYGLPYLIEYPEQIMKDKFDTLYHVLIKNFNTSIVSHRSGRWAMNDTYFDILPEYNIKVDCSVTPHISWENSAGLTVNSKGSDYSQSPEEPYIIKSNCHLLEIPLSIRKCHYPPSVRRKGIRPYLSSLKTLVKGKVIWLRPDGANLEDMLVLTEYIRKSNSDYIMFMLHSSELMPGGSPSFKTRESIEMLYHDLSILFEKISENFTGISLKDYYTIHSKDKWLAT